jgi:hypothetical protein
VTDDLVALLLVALLDELGAAVGMCRGQTTNERPVFDPKQYWGWLYDV